ncbi:MAG: hypothetical protein K2J10_06175 [Muribaculaceae bacterium]|nr:hypothetical protein [Muribaculaceae bacterium]
MRKTAILIIMCGAVAVAQMLPGDGAKVTVYGIDAEIAECADGLCDLSVNLWPNNRFVRTCLWHVRLDVNAL